MSTGGHSAEQIAQRGEDILHSVASTRMTVDWQRSTPWWFFVSGFVRLGWRTTHLLVALLGYALTELGLRLASRLFNAPGLQFFPGGVRPPFVPFGYDTALGPQAFSWTLLAYYIFVFLWLAVVWGLIGGFIVRRSVVELGMRTTIGWTGAVKLVLSRLRYMVEAVGMPLLCAAVMFLVPLVLGWLSRLGTPVEAVAVLLLLLSLPLVLAAAWLLILAILGYPLMVAAIVTEKDSDAFDGLSRAAAYLFQRPVTILISTLVAGTIATYLSMLVGNVILGVWDVYSQAFFGSRIEASEQLTQAPGLRSGFANSCYYAANWIVRALPVALLWSMLWSAVAAVYLIVRREVDHTDYDEIDLQEPGSPLALPSTRPGPSGVTQFGAPREASARGTSTGATTAASDLTHAERVPNDGSPLDRPGDSMES